jgi:hypothetical protein
MSRCVCGVTDIRVCSRRDSCETCSVTTIARSTTCNGPNSDSNHLHCPLTFCFPEDIYQAFLNPKASERQLLWHSRVVTIVIIAIGWGSSFAFESINDIWGFLTLTLGGGLLMPSVLRWYGTAQCSHRAAVAVSLVPLESYDLLSDVESVLKLYVL